MSGEPTESRYVAFISYAREDEGFARQLETEIEAHRPPGDRPVPEVFRDRSDFTGSEYHRALESHLLESETLIVLCSPHARNSEYVGDEIRRFAKLHGPDRIFPILLSGLPDNEAEDRKAFPPALLEVMGGIPLGAEYRGFGKTRDRISMGRYEAEWYKLLGNLYGMSPAELRAADKQRQMRAMRVRFLASIAVVFLLVAGLVGVWNLKNQADAATEEAWRQKADALQQKQIAEIAKAEALKQEQRAKEAEALARQMSEKAQTELAEAKRAPVSKPDAGAAILPRVYFQISSDSQRPLADRLKAALTGMAQKYVVPPYEVLKVGPTEASELRYFRESERQEAEGIAQALRNAGLEDVVARKIPGYEDSKKIRPRHFELWLRLEGGRAPG